MNLNINLYFLIFFLFFIFSKVSYSNESCIYEVITSTDEVKYTIQKSIKVDDQKGHVIRVFKTETKHLKKKKNCEGLILVKTDFFGISDYINKNGEVKGYSIGTYDDGSKIFSNLIGIAHTPEDQTKNGIVITTSVITGGTGVYKGIFGKGKGKIEFNPDTGFSSGKNTISYQIK